VTEPAPEPGPAGGVFKVVPERVGQGRQRVLAGTRWRVRGVVDPYVPGQTATIRFYRGTHKLFEKQMVLQPSSTGKSGFFLVGFRAFRPGVVTVKATKPATPGQVELVANPKRVRILQLRIRPGAAGFRAVRVLQTQLRSLGYVTGARGRYDDRTARAVMAFRKVVGMARTTEASPEVFRRLADGQGRFRIRYPTHGKHVEADLSRQVLALIAGGKVQRIYPISSGASVTPTILGSFRVYLKTPGTNAKGMVHSSYFIRGYAIHGYASVPPYPASHGCLRVPVPEAMSIFRWLSRGDRVDVYP
jgi:lipoprotein-anchoring transpeptidase ErfK/SrfK